MAGEEVEQRLKNIEDRLSRLESRLDEALPRHYEPPLIPPEAEIPAKSPSSALPDSVTSKPESQDKPSLITSILGWGGAIAFVLAASYLIRLALDSGWLTPARQVASASIAGLMLIGAGFTLRGFNRQYAGLLPAGGIVILFLAIYGGHLYYGLIDARTAALAVFVVCAVSLWLCRVFQSDLYALFAVVGSYSAPFLLSGLSVSIIDAVIYFSAWSVVFSIYAIWRKRRLIYLLALYLALTGFDMLWRDLGESTTWIAAFIFQTAQFLIFGLATVVFSVRHKSPLDSNTALVHLPALLLFYFLQYSLLDNYMPDMAPWVALASLAVVAGLYVVASRSLARPLPGGEFLLWSYVALVLFHAGYLESVPDEWAPWVALILIPVAVIFVAKLGTQSGAKLPIWITIALIFLMNYLRILFDSDLTGIPARHWLAVGYAALLYLGYFFSRGKESFRGSDLLMLYGGHVAAMSAALHFFDEPIVESTAWGIIALACLVLSWWGRDKQVGQSSLMIFGATAVKVLIYDLSGAPPVARIVSLLVLGLTFYIGGMLYQRMLGVDSTQ